MYFCIKFSDKYEVILRICLPNVKCHCSSCFIFCSGSSGGQRVRLYCIGVYVICEMALLLHFFIHVCMVLVCAIEAGAGAGFVTLKYVIEMLS